MNAAWSYRAVHTPNIYAKYKCIYSAITTIKAYERQPQRKEEENGRTEKKQREYKETNAKKIAQHIVRSVLSRALKLSKWMAALKREYENKENKTATYVSPNTMRDKREVRYVCACKSVRMKTKSNGIICTYFINIWYTLGVAQCVEYRVQFIQHFNDFHRAFCIRVGSTILGKANDSRK